MTYQIGVHIIQEKALRVGQPFSENRRTFVLLILRMVNSFCRRKKENLTSFKYYKGYEEVNNFTVHRSEQLQNVKNFS